MQWTSEDLEQLRSGIEVFDIHIEACEPGDTDRLESLQAKRAELVETIETITEEREQ